MHIVKYLGYIFCGVKPYLRTFDDIDKPIRPKQVLSIVAVAYKRELPPYCKFFLSASYAE